MVAMRRGAQTFRVGRLVSSNRLAAGHVISRIAASLLGSYAFVWGFASLTSALGLALGVPFGDAQTLAFLLAFLAALEAGFPAF